MTMTTLNVAPDLDVLAAGSTGMWFGLQSATAQAIVLKTAGGTSRSFNMAAGQYYRIQVTEVTTYAGAAGDLVGYKVRA